MNIMLNLKSPMQSWGDSSHSMTAGTKRGSLPFPSYAGVIGLVSTCMGVNRDRDPESYSNLLHSVEYVSAFPRHSVSILTDFQTMGSGYDGSHDIHKYMGKRSATGSIRATGYVNHARLCDDVEVTIGKLSNREYIEDNEFMVILSVDDSISDRVVNALRNPVWFPVMGRSSCIPSSRILFEYGKSVDDLIASMKSYWNVTDKLLAYTTAIPSVRYSKLEIHDVPNPNHKFKYHKRWIYKSII